MYLHLERFRLLNRNHSSILPVHSTICLLPSMMRSVYLELNIKSFIFIIKSKHPRIEHWGTPAEISIQLELHPVKQVCEPSC